jgi:phosphoglucomutase
LIDRLSELYFQFGTFEHKVYSYKFAGSEGAEKMKQILNDFRENKPTEIGALSVVNTKDYLEGIDDLPKANVLVFELEEGAEVIVRPSGTEPLIKTYVTLSKTKEENAKNLELIKAGIAEIVG